MTKNIKIVGSVFAAILTIVTVYKIIQTSNDGDNSLASRVTSLEEKVNSNQKDIDNLQEARVNDHISIVQIALDIKYIKEAITEIKQRDYQRD